MTQADPKSDVVDLGRADDTNALKPRASRRVRRTDGKYRLAVDLLLDDEASYAAARTLLYVIKAGGNPERLVDAVRTALGRKLDPAVDRLLRRLLQEFPERCFWGTDWPHPNHHHVPDDGQLVDLLAMIAPTLPALEALLVHNPQRFYRFEA